MHNKLFISIFILIFCGTVVSAQEDWNNHQEAQISIYPNPAIEFIMVQIDKRIPDLDIEFELNSMLGNTILIKPEEVGIGKYKIQVKGFTSGYYFLIIKIKNEDMSFRKAVRFLKN